MGIRQRLVVPSSLVNGVTLARRRRDLQKRDPQAWSRHPNYLGECGFWSGIYLFSRAAGISDILYAIGPVALWVFFRAASAPLMEERSRARRKDYDAASPSAILVPLPFLSRNAKRL